MDVASLAGHDEVVRFLLAHKGVEVNKRPRRTSADVR
jgi:hypothetical protein